jgi:hypothetical protein
MTLNFQKEGFPIAIIKGGKENNQKLYLSDKDNEKIKTFEKIQLKDGSFQQIPNTKRERDVGFICGASGSGKSTYCKNYIIEYHKTYKDRPIYLFSHLDEDKVLDDLGIIKRVRLSNQLLEENLTSKDFENCLVLMDDVEIITNKPIKKYVYQLMEEIAMTGRHFNTSLLMISHNAVGNDVKRILNECHFFVYFPWGQNLKYTLEKYIGIDQKQIKQIKSTKSRWAVIFKNYPQCVLTEKHAFVLSSE